MGNVKGMFRKIWNEWKNSKNVRKKMRRVSKIQERVVRRVNEIIVKERKERMFQEKKENMNEKKKKYEWMMVMRKYERKCDFEDGWI